MTMSRPPPLRGSVPVLVVLATCFFFFSAESFVTTGKVARHTVALELAKSPLGTSGSSSPPAFFTGGAFDKQEEPAVRIASKIRNVRDLGWTKEVRRRGSTRPRHRAWGGSSELPVQEKPNYDEDSPMCVEKWLTQDDFYKLVKDDSPAADTVFVALAGGGAFAEREVCDSLLQKWRVQGNKFDEKAFLDSMKKGRFDLALGWALFVSFNLAAASCIVLPTNPIAKGLEAAIESLR